MAYTAQYTEQIRKELQALPAEALRLLRLVREEFFTHETRGVPQEAREPTSHARTRQILASSPSNWAQDLMSEREDRL